MMKLNEVASPRISAARSLAARPDYNPVDPLIKHVVRKV